MKKFAFLPIIVCLVILALPDGILYGISPQVTIRSEVSLVNINFSALDKKGKPVSNFFKNIEH